MRESIKVGVSVSYPNLGVVQQTKQINQLCYNINKNLVSHVRKVRGTNRRPQIRHSEWYDYVFTYSGIVSTTHTYESPDPYSD